MRVDLNGRVIPYPTNVLLGKLRMSGLTDAEAYFVLAQTKSEFVHKHDIPDSHTLSLFVRDLLSSHPKEFSKNFVILTEYEELRRTNLDIPPIILILEGASATGKSMLAVRMIENLSSTRMLSTDTIRQILRTSFSKGDYPELFCHTYQAHKYKQTGPEHLPDVVRGYLAQCKIIQPIVIDMVSLIPNEGVTAIIEGVHIIPGKIKESNPEVIEIIINPSRADHEAMFTSKHFAGGLLTVSSSKKSRLAEFEATREIQEFMIDQARQANTHIIDFVEYEETEKQINRIIVDTVAQFLSN